MEHVDHFIKHTDHLWTLTGDWQGSSLRRRMTVMKTSSGGLVIHNAMALPKDHLTQLNQFGNIECIVIPNIFHDSEAPWFAERFPKAQIFSPFTQLLKTKKRCQKRQVFSIENDWTQTSWSKEVTAVPIPGLRWLAESFFIHTSSRTLVICDLAFNMKIDAFHGIERTLMRWNRVGHGFGPSRLAISLFMKDRKRVTRTLEAISRLDFDRIVVGHGDVIETGGKTAFINAFLRD